MECSIKSSLLSPFFLRFCTIFRMVPRLLLFFCHSQDNLVFWIHFLLYKSIICLPLRWDLSQFTGKKLHQELQTLHLYVCVCAVTCHSLLVWDVRLPMMVFFLCLCFVLSKSLINQVNQIYFQFKICISLFCLLIVIGYLSLIGHLWLANNTKWVSNCCLMPSETIFSYIMVRTSYISVRWCSAISMWELVTFQWDDVMSN